MLNFLKKDKIYDCAYPWYTMYLGIDTFSYCCRMGYNKDVVVPSISDYPNKFKNFKALWNNENFVKTRKHIINNKTLAVCPKDCVHYNNGADACFFNLNYNTQTAIDNINDEKHKERVLRNYKKAKNSFLKGETILRHKPVKLLIKTGSACNLKCIMCTNHKTNYHPNPDDIIRIIDECHDTLAFVSLFGGEPLITKTSLEIFKKFRSGEYKFSLGLVTNLQHYSEELLDGVPIARIVISTDGATKETYEKIRVGASFDKLIENINLLNKKRKENPLMQVPANYTVISENYHEILQAIKLYEDLGLVLNFSLARLKPDDPLNTRTRIDLRNDFLEKLNQGISLTKNQGTANSLLGIKKVIENTANLEESKC